MTPENAKAFERLVAIMSGDYAQLLMRGELIARTDDPAGWRKEMRDKARLDRLKIRTGRSDRDSHVVWAIRVREPQLELDDEDGPAFKTLTYQHHIQTTARANGHTFDRWIINHEGRAAGRCSRVRRTRLRRHDRVHANRRRRSHRRDLRRLVGTARRRVTVESYRTATWRRPAHTGLVDRPAKQQPAAAGTTTRTNGYV